MNDKPIRRHACGKGDPQFSAGSHVELHSFLVGEPRHRGAQEGLCGICNAVTEPGHCLPAACPEMLLVVDEQRGPELCGEIECVAAGDGKAPPGADNRFVRE